jgi:hypothetical protein
MSSNSFFYEQKEQSLIKARIVEKYFWAWTKVITATLERIEKQRRLKEKQKSGASSRIH